MHQEASRRQFLLAGTQAAAFAVTGVLVGGRALADEQSAPWKAGISKAVITPEKSVWLAGYGSKRPPEIGRAHV